MKVCKRCVLPQTYPGIEFDEEGTCNYCNNSREKEISAPADPFDNEQQLIECMEKIKKTGGKYDVLVPLSGGIDSCNALITIVEKFKLKALGFHNDHGYEDEVATDNVKKLCKQLDVDLVIMQQDLLFMKKLWKYVNESDEGLNSCYVCGNILYINALEVADKFNISLVINGYSKGQAAMMSDKDCASVSLEKMIKVIEKTGDKAFFYEFMDKYKILQKKKDYQTRDDLEMGLEPGKILVVPFYVFDFYKTDKEALIKEVQKLFDWQPMPTSYPARTTNCEMIWLNTYMDRKKMGYSLYEIEYSELIRKGEMTRQQVLTDLEFNPPAQLIQRLAHEIGVDIKLFKKENQSTGAGTENETVNIEFDF
ncbi:MAG: hypothetical protein JSV88_17045 [Candidatus Aminicenantes bacterium]|nr:MAG: hypothetical protein JSV88_17045 [Candidatus Aminicenantes bacterium]